MPTNTVYKYFPEINPSNSTLALWYPFTTQLKRGPPPPSLAICDSAPPTNEHQWTKPVCSIPYKSSLKHQY